MMTLQLLKQELPADRLIVDTAGEEEARDEFAGIRCPLCEWRPTASSRWCCYGAGTPEPTFAWCGTVWNTFATRGRCPGCDHQWKWTSCLRCTGWSLHVDWYESDEGK